MSNKEIEDSPSKGTAILLEKAALLEEAKRLKIEELLQERTNLETETAVRAAEIKEELKALGYKTPRVRKQKALDNAAESQ